MDSSALIGLVGALFGSLLGAAGTYWATVGGARAQSRARLNTALSSLRDRLADENVVGSQRQLSDLRDVLDRVLAATEAGRRNEGYVHEGQTVGPDDPDGLGRILGRARLGLPGLLPSSWLAALAPDVAQMSPRLYNALAAYEGVQNFIVEQTRQALPQLFAFAETLEASKHQTLRQAAAESLPGQTRRLRMHVNALEDPYRSLAEIVSEVERCLPAS